MAIKDGDKKPEVSSTPNAHTISCPPDGEIIAGSATEKLAFHGVVAVAQRSGVAQAAVATTGATNTSPYGFTTAAQANALVTLVNELRAALVEKGIIKGA